MSLGEEHKNDDVNFDDFSRRPERFGKNEENSDKIIFPDEFERMKLNKKDKQRSHINDENEKNKELDSRIVFPDDKLLSEENKSTGDNGNFEDYIRRPGKSENNEKHGETDGNDPDFDIRMSEDTEKEEC